MNPATNVSGNIAVVQLGDGRLNLVRRALADEAEPMAIVPRLDRH